MLKVILFDIDNTLLSFDAYVKETMRRGFEEFGIGRYEDAMFQVFLETNNRLWRLIEQGEMDFAQLQRNRWNLIFERLGISFDGGRFEAYFRERLFDSAIPEEGSLELLEYLKGRYRLGVASNGPYLQQVNRLRICGMLPYFSDLFISEEIGASKPSAAFFDTCITRLREKDGTVEAREIMIVGDSLTSDMAGGRGCGMQTCFYHPDRTSVPLKEEADLSVCSLLELRNIL